MSEIPQANRTINNELTCAKCGAILKFKPGTLSLVCDHCGQENEIAKPDAHNRIDENDLEELLARGVEQDEKMEVATVNCNACGAVVTMDPHVISDKCPFCASNLVVTGGTTSSLHRPQYLLPFYIDNTKARENFKGWIGSLWFAPNDLAGYARNADELNGMYLPYWTFDVNTYTDYTGQRGDAYYETEHYTTQEDGKTVTRTRQVRKIRWYPASGNVGNTFDDVLVEATKSLNLDKLRELEPWDLKKLIPYNDKFLSGFRTETYRVDIRTAYGKAKERMYPTIEATIRRDIGGDEQIISHVSIDYESPTYKHVLLPVWISAYRYHGKVYQILVNARTGEVQGERPYSAIKIAFAVFCVLLIIAIIYFINQYNQGHYR
ncbi:MAG: hypothetical protein ACAI35_13010 [Candidatus Methylacidiphilales bacterium]|nr:hypothetical protein [Candidatus Methylacidiphilales bacterium]